MSGKRKDITGLKFGKLKVLEFSHMIGKHSYWRCICDCGNEHVSRCDCLKSGLVKSCGCANTIDKRKPNSIRSHKLYRVWWRMKSCCYNPNNSAYKHYGARGIRICEEWLKDYETFYNWSIENGYREGLSIDRIDNDGDYEPSNCRWATQHEQMLNTSRSLFNRKSKV